MTANNWFRTEGSDLIYTPSRVSSFEILRSSSDNGLPRLERKQIRPEEIEAWLTDSQMQASKSSSSLRILFGECSQLSHIDPTSSQFLRIPFSRHKFERVLENMRVQPQFVWALEDPSAQVSRFRGIMPKDWCKLIFWSHLLWQCTSLRNHRSSETNALFTNGKASIYIQARHPCDRILHH